MRLRRSWRTFGINRCRPAPRGVSILWVCSRWWVHVLFLLHHLHRAQLLPPSLSHLCLFAQDSLAAEIEGTMRKELQMDDPDVEEQRYSFFPPKKPTWLPTVLPKKVWGSCTENAGNDICICIFSLPSPGSNQSEFSRRWKTWTWCVSSVRRSLRPLSTSRDPIRRLASRRVAPAVRAHHAPTPFMGVRWEVASSWTTRPAVFWRVQMMGREADLAVYSIIVMPFLRACRQCLWFTESLFLF